MQFPGRQFFLEGLIDPLLTLDAIHAGKFGADHKGLEMLSIAVEGEMFAGHAGADEFLDLIGVHRSVQALSFQPRLSRLSVSRETTAKLARTTPRLISGAMSETPKKP